MEDERLESVMRDDAYIIFLNAVKKGLPQALLNVFKNFKENEDSDALLSHVMSASEEMLEAFKEQNFSNSEIGTLYKLRQNRSAGYRDAFQGFGKNNDLDELVVKLKEIIEEELAEDAGDSNSEQNNRFLQRGRSFDDKIGEIFKMAF